MLCFQESFEIIASSSQESGTPQANRAPKDLNISSNKSLKTSNSTLSLEDLGSLIESIRTPTPKHSIFVVEPTKEGKPRSTSNRITIDFANILDTQDSVQKLIGGLEEELRNPHELVLIMRNQKGEMINGIKEQLSIISSKKFENLQSLELDFFRSQIASGCLEYLNKEGFSNFPSLQKFKINLWGSDINNMDIQRFAWNFKHYFGELEEFYCNFGHIQVTEKAMIQLFHEMPKMKHFEMGVGNCTFSDYALKIFIRNTLYSMKSLQSFSFQFEGTKISGSQVQDLFRNLPESLKKLRLDLRWTRVSNDALEYFLKEKLVILKDLIEIEIKVDCTPLSEKIVKKIEEINKRYARKIDHKACLKYLKTLRFEENYDEKI